MARRRQHHVVTDDGRVHCFAQLGAASFVAGARTHLAGDMAVDLVRARTARSASCRRDRRRRGRPSRARHDRSALRARHAVARDRRTSCARRCAARGRHGSTGRGVAEAKLGPMRIFAGELGGGFDFAARVREVRAALIARAASARSSADRRARRRCRPRARARRAGGRRRSARRIPRPRRASRSRCATSPPVAGHVILESAQGALLDRDHGFFPHVTPSRITRARRRATPRARSASTRPLEVWGVLRAYHTRHGEGPFPSEDRALAARLPELHNREDGPPAGSASAGSTPCSRATRSRSPGRSIASR